MLDKHAILVVNFEICIVSEIIKYFCFVRIPRAAVLFLEWLPVILHELIDLNSEVGCQQYANAFYYVNGIYIIILAFY